MSDENIDLGEKYLDNELNTSIQGDVDSFSSGISKFEYEKKLSELTEMESQLEASKEYFSKKVADFREEQELKNEEDINKNKIFALKEKEIKERFLELDEQLELLEIAKKEHEFELKKQQTNYENNSKLKLIDEKNAIINETQKELDEKIKKFNKEFEEMRETKREKLDKELKDRENNLEIKLSAKISEVDNKIENLRKKAEEEYSVRIEKARNEVEEIRKNAERNAEELIELKTNEVNERQGNLDEREINIKNREINFCKKEEEVRELECKLIKENEQVQGVKAKNKLELSRLDRIKDEIEERENNLENEINSKINDRIKSFEENLKVKEEELVRLRFELGEMQREKQKIESFVSRYGTDPQVIENEISILEQKNRELKEEVAKRLTIEDANEIKTLKDEKNRLVENNSILITENSNLKVLLSDLESLKSEKIIQTGKVINLEHILENSKADCDNLRAEISRLTIKEVVLADREKRIEEIRNSSKPISILGNAMASEENTSSEIEWLENIHKSFIEFGIPFSKRILYSFHTALKITDWSTITVLAGVSGTGKSELPKLYAAFGGFNFINVPVQPSWDSQESMLGYFNSIDNRFEPQELLSFLVEANEREDLENYMSIVLLDEMNLAHVEHYFADFLSKLEDRRSKSKNNVPTISVKLGAGVDPYELSLTRYVLWTGTMNQDETTKSLSDKVLDRGIVINFPRPKTLNSRTKMGILDKMVNDSNRPMLHKGTWNKWISRVNTLSVEQMKEINHYKSIVQEINSILEHVGRAVGHRVWQSIEFYILNYPTVCFEIERLKSVGLDEATDELKEAMKTAFEDQIVQKIMPKLRGIETRGKGREYLQKIEDLLEKEGFERLKDDFEIACEQGYGQFIWSSAKYIEDDIIGDSSSDIEQVSATDDGEI